MNNFKWIPITEKLPEEEQQVLISCANGYVTYDFFRDGQFETFNDDNVEDEEKVLAWMPLPEPYKVESEDKK